MCLLLCLLLLCLILCVFAFRPGLFLVAFSLQAATFENDAIDMCVGCFVLLLCLCVCLPAVMRVLLFLFTER